MVTLSGFSKHTNNFSSASALGPCSLPKGQALQMANHATPSASHVWVNLSGPFPGIHRGEFEFLTSSSAPTH